VIPRRAAAARSSGPVSPALRRVLDAVAQPVLVLSAGDDLKLLYANSAFFTATRLARGSLQGGSVAAWLPADAQRRVLAAIGGAGRVDKPVHVALDLFNMSADLQSFAHGRRRYWIATLVASPQTGDMDHSHAELRRLTAQLVTAMELEGMAAWTWRSGADWVTTDFRGSSATKLLQAGSMKEFLNRLPNAERPRVQRAMQVAMQGDEVTRLEVFMDAADGTGRWFSMAARRFLDAGGSPAGLVGVTRDITKRKDAFRSLARNEERLRAILEAEPECVKVVDGAGVVRLINPAGLALLGAEDVDRVLDRPAADFIVPEYRKSFRSLHKLAMAGKSGMLEIEVEGLDGRRRYVESHVAPLRDGKGAVTSALTVERDVTERHQLAGEIIEASNREQERIGHDLHDGLGQELTGIALLLTGLLGRLDRPTPELRAELADILELVNGALRNTRSLARGLSPVAVERGGLALALRALVSQAGARTGLSMSFTARGWQDDRLDPANALQLYRIAQESLNNALRHADSRHIVMTLTMSRAGARLRIADDGRGIAAEASPEAGLGLKIMAYRAGMIGAELKIEPRTGGGTVVSVACPCGLARGRRRRDGR
jgi:two-component system sensor histidine kinase UhpB